MPRARVCRPVWLVVLLALSLGAPARAAVIFTVTEFTSDTLSLTLSGTLDADTGGVQPGWLAIKNDWSNHVGVHTEFLNSIPTITVNTIVIGGVAPLTTDIQNGASDAFADSIVFQNPNGSGLPLFAGTSIAGTLTLSGAGAFSPTAGLELLSGFGATGDWARLEAAAVPEPTTALLLAGGLAGLALRRAHGPR